MGAAARTGRTRPKRPNAERSARQKQLELLRKQRAGEAANSQSEDELEITTQDEDTLADASQISELEEDSNTSPLPQTAPADLDQYEEDFVTDDDDNLGAPAGLDEIPVEFTSHAHKKPIEHFKDVVEWMVHNKLNPAFARNDQVYTIAVRKLDDEAQGYARSKFMSTAWKPDFVNALKRYPELASTVVPTMFDQKCEACGRSGHPAKHHLTFGGKPYYRESLEEISSDEESDIGQETLGIQRQVFFLGR